MQDEKSEDIQKEAAELPKIARSQDEAAAAKADGDDKNKPDEASASNAKPKSAGNHHLITHHRSTKILLAIWGLVAIAALAVVLYSVEHETSDSIADETAALESNDIASGSEDAIAEDDTAAAGVAVIDTKVKNSAFEDQINGSMQIGAYLADNVTVTANGSDCCGILAKDQAQTEITNRIQDYTPLDFTETGETATKIKTNLTAYAGYSIGLASTGETGQIVFLYHLADSGKVDTVVISTSDLLDIE